MGETMSSSEDYLDSLLASALQQNSTEEKEISAEPELPSAEETEKTYESDKMSPEEIAALFDMLDAEKEENQLGESFDEEMRAKFGDDYLNQPLPEEYFENAGKEETEWNEENELEESTPQFDLEAMLDKVIAQNTEDVKPVDFIQEPDKTEMNQASISIVEEVKPEDIEATEGESKPEVIEVTEEESKPEVIEATEKRKPEVIAPDKESNADADNMIMENAVADDIEEIMKAAMAEPAEFSEQDKIPAVENEEPEATEPAVTESVGNVADNNVMSPEEIAALFDELDADKEEEQIGEKTDELFSLLQEDAGEGDFSEESIIAQLEAAKRTGEEAAKEEASQISENQDIFDLLSAFGEEDDGLTDISELLQKSDQNEYVGDKKAEDAEEDVTAFLDESVDEDSQNNKKKSKRKQKEKKGLFDFLPFGKKKNKEDSAEEMDSAKTDDAETRDAVSASVSGDTANGTAEPMPDVETASITDLFGMQEEGAKEENNAAAHQEEQADLSIDFGEVEESKNKKEKKKDKNKDKKPGFFARLFQALTEEVPEPETVVPEQKSTKLSDENLEILSELDEEEIPVNKKKEKKGKKEKNEKEKKKKKAAKPKKEKVVIQEKEEGKSIPKKHVAYTFVLSFSILIALLLITMYVPTLLLMQEARDCYYQEDYQGAYFALYGKDLNESDQLIYEKSKLIVLLQRKWDSYVNYANMNMREEALNVLLQGLLRYEELKERAEEYGVLPQLNATREQILGALEADYGILEPEAMEIISYSDLDYTDKLQSVLNGTDFIPRSEILADEYGIEWNDSADNALSNINQEDNLGEEMPDLLPEEEEYLNGGGGNDNSENADENFEDENSENGDSESANYENNDESNAENVEVILDSNQF